MCLLICTFSGEMGYWDLGERERERASEREKRNTCGEQRGFQFSLSVFERNICFYYFGMLR